MKKTNKKLTFWDILYWTLAVVPFLISLSFYSRLPDQVPKIGRASCRERV